MVGGGAAKKTPQGCRHTPAYPASICYLATSTCATVSCHATHSRTLPRAADTHLHTQLGKLQLMVVALLPQHVLLHLVFLPTHSTPGLRARACSPASSVETRTAPLRPWPPALRARPGAETRTAGVPTPSTWRLRLAWSDWSRRCWPFLVGLDQG